MNEIHYFTLRAATTTRALSTMGECPRWDRAVSDYLRLDALYRADAAFGATSQAEEAHTLEGMAIEGQYGREWRAIPEAMARHNAAQAALRSAEDKQVGAFAKPLWAAQRTLALTPAPSLNAALFKAEAIESEDIWNDNEFRADAFELVAVELARFAGEA